MKKNLFTTNDYGIVTVHIKEIMDNKNITRNSLARAIGARFEVINKWYSGNIEKIDLDVLARICYVLECTPGDVLFYE